MAYQINLTGKEIDERLQNVGTPADKPNANGTLSARLNKNAADIADIGGRQTNIEEVVSGARTEAYFSLRFLNLIVNSKFIADIDKIKVVLYRWSGKRYSVLELFTKNGIGESQKIIQYVIILKQTDVNGVNIRTPYIHYNDDATEETLENALENAFGGRISYRKNKKKRWRLQAFLNGKPITAPFDFRVSIDCNDNYSLTKGGMMRSVPSSGSVVYDGLFNGSQWLRCKKGDLLDLSYSADAGILFPPTPGNIIAGDNNAKGCVVAVKNITQDASSVTVLWTVGDSFYEIGVEERVESDEYVYRCTSPAKKLCDDIYDYASKMNSGTLRDLYISAGAKYNEATGFYELNGLTDITEEQMRKIYKYAGTPQVKASYAYSQIRTNFPSPGFYNGSIYDGMFYASKIEVINLGYKQTQSLTILEPFVSLEGQNAFYLCKNLRIIYGRIEKYHTIKDWDLTFGECGKLEEVRIYKLGTSIKFSWSPNLSKESVQYMITNANPPSGAAAGSIAITLHPTAYARLKDDADIVAALEAKGGIVTLVSA